MRLLVQVLLLAFLFFLLFLPGRKEKGRVSLLLVLAGVLSIAITLADLVFQAAFFSVLFAFALSLAVFWSLRSFLGPSRGGFGRGTGTGRKKQV